MKKAMTWLTDQGIEFEFQDYKKTPPSEEQAKRWLSELPLDQVINKRGTTFRKLPDDVKANLDVESAVGLMTEQPSLIKRPLLEHQGKISLGFKPDIYSEIFSS